VVDDDIPAQIDTSDDLMIAQMLQKQFDKEYNLALAREERSVNRNCKVTVAYSKYRMSLDDDLNYDSSDDEDEDYYNDEKRDLDIFETKKKEIGEMPRTGFKKIGDRVVTKHDKEISQRENAKRIMEFPPGIETGDGGGFDMQVSNKVYNKIRNFSIREGKRKNRIQDKEDRAVAEQALDPKTRVLLYKMVNGGVLDGINGVISTGKEAVIIHADGGPGHQESEEPMNVPKECVIKVFKTTLSEFKTRDKYIRDDYRFRDRFSKQNPRKVIHMWAEKEMRNLVKMAKGGLRVPEVVVLKKHVLLMSFIGQEGRPAPKLKDAAERMSEAELELAYRQVVEMMVKLYTECHLVHADLSEYNILWWQREAWFIDVSQAVEPIHPSGLDFLLRDCTNIYNFFSKKGVQCEEPHQECQGEDNFDYCWEQSQDQSSTPARSIPGHTKPKPAAKSPRSPRSDLTKSPSNSSSKSPGSRETGGRSPKSPVLSEFVGLSDHELRKLKISLLAQESNNESEPEVVLPRKPSTIKFQDCSEFETVDPDEQ